MSRLLARKCILWCHRDRSLQADSMAVGTARCDRTSLGDQSRSLLDDSYTPLALKIASYASGKDGNVLTNEKDPKNSTTSRQDA